MCLITKTHKPGKLPKSCRGIFAACGGRGPPGGKLEIL